MHRRSCSAKNASHRQPARRPVVLPCELRGAFLLLGLFSVIGHLHRAVDDDAVPILFRFNSRSHLPSELVDTLSGLTLAVCAWFFYVQRPAPAPARVLPGNSRGWLSSGPVHRPPLALHLKRSLRKRATGLHVKVCACSVPLDPLCSRAVLTFAASTAALASFSWSHFPDPGCRVAAIASDVNRLLSILSSLVTTSTPVCVP